MVTIQREGIILESTDLSFESESVMNPAVIAEGNTVHMFYRAVKEGNCSTIGYCRLEGALKVVQRNEEPLIRPEYVYEAQGVEDPRIVKIDDTYYLTYTAYDGTSAVGALAVSSDLVHFEKKGVITSQFTFRQFKRLMILHGHQIGKYFRSYNKRESNTNFGKKIYLTDKNVVFFPRKINGKFYFMHRIKPDIQLVSIGKLEDLTTKFWTDYFINFFDHILLKPQYDHEASYIGAGCPPIETPEGWLLIYHSVYDTPEGYVYSACAALLDLNDPSMELARLPYPLFTPDTDYELLGIVNRVCFPTGTTLFGDRLYIYYGAADKCIACISVVLQELVNELITHKK